MIFVSAATDTLDVNVIVTSVPLTLAVAVGAVAAAFSNALRPESKSAFALS